MAYTVSSRIFVPILRFITVSTVKKLLQYPYPILKPVVLTDKIVNISMRLLEQTLENIDVWEVLKDNGPITDMICWYWLKRTLKFPAVYTFWFLYSTVKYFLHIFLHV